MASVKKSDIPEVAAFMTDYWNFVKSVWIPEDSEEYWAYVHLRAEELYQKHPFDFAKQHILTYCEFLNNEYQKKKGKSNGKQGKRDYSAAQ